MWVFHDIISCVDYMIFNYDIIRHVIWWYYYYIISYYIIYLIICYAAWDLGWICVIWMKHVMFIWHDGIWAVFLMYWLLLVYNSFCQIRYSGCGGASFNISCCCVTSWCFLLFNVMVMANEATQMSNVGSWFFWQDLLLTTG